VDRFPSEKDQTFLDRPLATQALHPVDAGCDLTLTHSFSVDDIHAAAATVAAGDDPTVILARNGAGRRYILDELAVALDGSDLPWAPEALQDRYAAMLAWFLGVRGYGLLAIVASSPLTSLKSALR
jgi:hypothetical protein